MDCDELIRRAAAAAFLLCGCPSETEPGDTDGDTDAMQATDGPACMPGATMACACTDGSTGTQECNTEGTAFGPCACSGTDSSATSTSPPTTGETSGDPTTDPTQGTDSAESTGASDTDSSGESTAGEGCTPGEVSACDCGEGPGFARCSDAGELGPCMCCEGSHPLVEGDMRFCEEGVCYCGDLDMEPPLDVCYEQQVADACCPIDVVCY